MSRSLTRVLVVILTASALATRTYAAIPNSAAGALLDSFGVLALEELRTRGFTNSTSNVGVNNGSLFSHGALMVPNGTVAASSVRLGDGSVCKKLVANTATKATSGCGPVPGMSLDSAILGILDPADVCEFPKPFPTCGGRAIIVGHGATQTLDPGTYGDVLVEGGGAGVGTLILNGGGQYVFCSLRVSRYAKLYVKKASEIDVKGDLAFSNLSTVGPAPGSGLAVRDVRLLVNGARLRFARKATVHGKVCAPNGSLFMNDGATLDGCALAKRIRTDRVTVKGTCVLAPSSTTVTTTSTPPTTSTTTTTTSTTHPPVCGNSQVESGEQCDGSVPAGIVCLDSPGGAILEAECPLCTTGENGCKIDCSCCPSGKCGTTTSTTSSTIPPPVTTTVSSTSTSLPTTSTSVATTSSTVTSTVPTTVPTTIPTTVPTTSTSTSSTSTSASSSITVTTTSSSSTTTAGTIPPTTTTIPTLAFTIATGTANCGGAGFVTPPAAPLSGQVNDGANAKLADLGLGCLYFGGGKNTNIPGGIIPTGSTTFFGIASRNGNAVTLGGASGPPTGCTKGAGPAKHCIKGELGTDGLGACTSDANCTNHGGSCVLDANCFFGPPLSIPNPTLTGTSTCVINAIQTDIAGTGDLGTGTASVVMTLASRVYLTGTSYDDNTTPSVIEACPRCISNTCNKGANAGKPCATTAPNFLSLDCPPTASQFLATLPIALNPFTTGTSTLAAANGVFCPNQIATPSNPLNTGALGKPLGRSIKESGIAAGNLTDHAPHAGALASTFCIPATGNALIDPVAGLPGPGALSVAGSIVFNGN